MVQLLDSEETTAALSLSANASRALAEDGRTYIHPFGTVGQPSILFIRGSGIIALHRPDPHACLD